MIDFSPNAFRSGLPRIALTCTIAIAALAVTGCAEGEPRCSCSPRDIELLDVPVGGKKGADFTVTNSGDGGRLSWYIEPVYQSTLGLRILQPSSVYVLEEGQEAAFTLYLQPTREIADTTVSLRVGLDDCVVNVRLSAAEFDPACSVSTSSVEFHAAVGDTLEQQVYVFNSGGGRLTGTIAPSGCGAPFGVSFFPANYNLAPGDSTLVRVRYLPVVATVEGAPDECTIGLGSGCEPILVRGVATDVPAPGR